MNTYQRTKYACYTTNVSMSVVSTLSPLLFLTFRSLYGLSYSMLGALVLINFCTQLCVDLIFSFYSYKFNIRKIVRCTPLITVIGLFLYAVLPVLLPGATYAGLVIGTIIFSASSGLAEVLISPVIAEIPAENPEREMSKLHSVYAWGVVAVVIVSTVFIKAFGKENWPWLALLWMIVPLISCLLFSKAKIPPLKTPEKASHTLELFKGNGFLLCVLCIFFGGASECTMAQWSSSYLEQALGIPKLWGDIFGVAMFAVMLGLGRSLYARFGKNIYRVLILSASGATVCYLTAALSNAPFIGLMACALTGLCTAMLWPGSLIAASDQFPSANVAAFALMAAGGDLGGAVGPQIVGSVTDFVNKRESLANLAQTLHLTTEQFGMKIGLISAALFPLLATICFILVQKRRGSHAKPHRE